MKITKVLLVFLLVMSMALVTAFLAVFTIPDEVKLNVRLGDSQKNKLQCYRNPEAKPIDRNGDIAIFVWNIYKQSKENWRESLEQYSQSASLGLLQEVSMTEEFKAYASKSSWYRSHVDAFSAFGVSSGVLTLSKNSPLLACAYLEVEPWILLPKSGIYAVFPLSDERELAVVNLHSINFTYGIEEYEQQIARLAEALKAHQGPIIFAGDLNAWSVERFDAIRDGLEHLGLKEVKFTPDNRTQFVNGMPLDYIFYRDLELISASSPISEASDHNPLLVKFRL
jgi:endonuclease/exonuclease/phosphatase (EEP) superfamily protein YafD